jgi:hypothetical protein
MIWDVPYAKPSRVTLVPMVEANAWRIWMTSGDAPLDCSGRKVT